MIRCGPNELRDDRGPSRFRVLRRQFASPLLLLLVVAAVIAAGTGEIADATIVLGIVLASVGIGYQREYSAHTAAAALRAQIAARTTVLRDGEVQSVPTREVVPGDVVTLAAGSLVPADGLVIDVTDCYVSESVLTGESFPVQKAAGRVPASASLHERSNCVFLGTNVRSGTLRCLVVATGGATEFGGIAKRLELKPPETEFELGLRRYGYLLTISMLAMVLLIFAAHMLGGRPVVETLLFAVALAVGLSPELLPVILSANLARGATMMARRGVLVRRLSAIENLGSMDVLCTDKTGTLTEGVISLEGAYDAAGAAADSVLELGCLNAALETGLPSPLDDAIVARRRPDLTVVRKLAEVPFDFTRKRVSVVIERGGQIELICKGAFRGVADVCDTLSGGQALDAAARAGLERLYEQWSADGIRVLAVAQRVLPVGEPCDRTAEKSLTFSGFLTFIDRPKEGVARALADLRALGVAVKLISGDTRLVAEHVASLVGMRSDRVLTGADLDAMRDEALWHEAERTDSSSRWILTRRSASSSRSRRPATS